jgi:hypothetical protein
MQISACRHGMEAADVCTDRTPVACDLGWSNGQPPPLVQLAPSGQSAGRLAGWSNVHPNLTQPSPCRQGGDRSRRAPAPEHREVTWDGGTRATCESSQHFQVFTTRTKHCDCKRPPNIAKRSATKAATRATHSITPHRTAPLHTALHRTAPHRTTPHHTAPHRTTPHHTTPHHATPHQ